MRAGAVAAAVAVLAVAGCGSGPDAPAQSTRPDEVTLTPAADGTQSVEVEADDSFRFHPSVINARPGPVELTLTHAGRGAPHNWRAAQLPGASVPLLQAGESRSVRFTVGRAGDYRFVCSIHEAQGQVGRLVVTAP